MLIEIDNAYFDYLNGLVVLKFSYANSQNSYHVILSNSVLKTTTFRILIEAGLDKPFIREYLFERFINNYSNEGPFNKKMMENGFRFYIHVNRETNELIVTSSYKNEQLRTHIIKLM